MTKSGHSMNRDLAAALKRQARRTGENTASVRGSRLMLAAITAIPGGGLVEVDGDMQVRRLTAYTPTIGDLVVLADFGDGNWAVLGKLATT